MNLPVLEGLADCTRCDLHRTRGEVVLPEGHPSGGLAVVGEAPDGEDDLMGRPFAGRSGDLLRKRLAEAGLAKACWFTHAVKCRLPKGLRAARAAHRDACKGWLLAELEAVRPRVVLALGRLPARVLLGPPGGAKLEELAGGFYEAHAFEVAVWHSPKWFLSGGRRRDEATVEFFSRVKGRLGGAAY